MTTTESDAYKDKLKECIRTALQAKMQFWDAMTHLEQTMEDTETGFVLTGHKEDLLSQSIDNLAAPISGPLTDEHVEEAFTYLLRTLDHPDAPKASA
ncbi:hypothetical protein LC612_36200 [Nostoc sp. CHAB 5834]|nr:hypothetical protein [Nostoc sp. CHAB 5834]